MAGVICTETPAGAVLAFATASAPSGWLLCNGTAVSRTTYSALFAAIGIAHGSGDGSTTFNLPDYRGKFLRAVDGGAGNDPDTTSRTAMNTGGNAGDAVGSVQADQFATHTHVIGLYGNSPGYTGDPASSTDSLHNNYTSGAAGGTETRPKNAYIYYAIKF